MLLFQFNLELHITSNARRTQEQNRRIERKNNADLKTKFIVAASFTDVEIVESIEED